MKNGSGQLTLILLLMLALFLQIEGVVPDIFAGSDEPLVITSQKDGLEFNAVIDDKSFSKKDKLIVETTIKNISAAPIPYYAVTDAYGIRGALGAALYSSDGRSEFTDEYAAKTAGMSSNASVLNGELKPGRTINCDFTLLPYSMDKGRKHIAAPGEYILKLWYSKGDEGSIETEIPVTLVKRFGRMYIKSNA